VNALPAETDRKPETLPEAITVTRLRDPQCDTLGIRRGDPNGCKGPAVGKRVRDGSGDSSFRLSVSQNAVSCHTVLLKVRRGAPTIQATIVGSPKSSMWIQDLTFP